MVRTNKILKVYQKDAVCMYLEPKYYRYFREENKMYFGGEATKKSHYGIIDLNFFDSVRIDKTWVFNDELKKSCIFLAQKGKVILMELEPGKHYFNSLEDYEKLKKGANKK